MRGRAFWDRDPLNNPRGRLGLVVVGHLAGLDVDGLRPVIATDLSVGSARGFLVRRTLGTTHRMATLPVIPPRFLPERT